VANVKALPVISSLLLLALFSSLGCAPALSGMQPAHVAAKHHAQAEFGMDVSIPTGTITDAIDAAQTLVSAAKERQLTEAEVQQVYQAAGATLLNPPSATPHVGLGFTVVNNLEISLRYATSSLRLGGRYQFLNKEKHGIDASAGLGLGYFILPLPLGDTLKIIELEDFTRFQLDIPVVFGTRGSWYRLWGGPRFMYTRFGTELKLTLPEIPGVSPGEVQLASFGGNGFYVGGQAGVAVGYKYVFLGFELTFVRLIMNGNLEVLQKPVTNIDLSSNIVYPALGLMGEF
jgi:hypothetical protein